jgi:hypothetical protein
VTGPLPELSPLSGLFRSGKGELFQRRLPMLDLTVLGLLYAAAAAMNIASVDAVSANGVLTGEEMSVSIRDVLFTVEARAQASDWSTGFAAPFYYWLGSQVDHPFGLFDGRDLKAVTMALLAPLVYLVLRRRLGCTFATSAIGGSVVVLLPGVMMYGWMAIETGLDSVLGVIALLLATSPRFWWPASIVVSAVAFITYPTGAAWLLACVAIWVHRLRRVDRGPDEARGTSAAVTVAVAVVLLPYLWWTNVAPRLLTGGGTMSGDLLEHLTTLVHQLAVNGHSYYYFGDAPGWGSPALAFGVAVCVLTAAWRRFPALWPWLLAALATVVLWLPAGNMPGLRRAIPLSIVAALVLAVALDILWRAIPTEAAALALGAIGAMVVLPLIGATITWQEAYRSGEHQLTADFPIAQGPMLPTLWGYYDGLESGRLTIDQMMRDHDGARTLAVVWMLADRNGRDTSKLPDPAEIAKAATTTGRPDNRAGAG